MELLGEGAETEGDFAAGEAFAVQGVDLAVGLGAGDGGAVGEDGTDGEEARRGGRAQLRAAGEDATDGDGGAAGEAGDLAVAESGGLELREMETGR